MPFQEFVKQFDEPTLKALSIAISASGVGAKLVLSARDYFKERAGDHRRAKHLQYVHELAGTLANLDGVSVASQPEIVRMRGAIVREVGLVHERVQRTYPLPVDLSPLTVPARTRWQRLLLLYWPKRKLAWLPQLLYYYFCFCLLVVPLASAELGAGEVVGVWALLAAVTLGLRFWAAITEYTGRPTARPLWQRVTLLYRPLRARGFVAHAAYWFLGLVLLAGLIAPVIERKPIDSDTWVGVLACAAVLIACQQWARAYDAPPALVISTNAEPAPPAELAQSASAGMG